MRQLINQIKHNVYLQSQKYVSNLTSMTNQQTINIGRIALPEGRHPLLFCSLHETQPAPGI